jgi:hypothetical protein
VRDAGIPANETQTRGLASSSTICSWTTTRRPVESGVELGSRRVVVRRELECRDADAAPLRVVNGAEHVHHVAADHAELVAAFLHEQGRERHPPMALRSREVVGDELEEVGVLGGGVDAE